ncbi:MAG: hypothetical protein A2Y15_07010 [Clostridiales bacterium GWF2_36_10]|nr:MAG: hypothetical protein A2Y15_07010 [Clostridiales bacterium GWF2_36_10]HAN21365.1 DUF4093 domain-containing protein [Clostridiales bacterium]
MEENKIYLKYPVLVEGKYDKIRLSNIISSTIISLGGFSVFNDKEKMELIRRFSAQKSIIILTDSDKAGLFIRNKIKGMISPDKIINVYTPQIQGKEKRKDKPSKEGYLGVEGVDDELLRSLLIRFTDDSNNVKENGAEVSSAEFYTDGFSGSINSDNMRKLLAKELSLPENMTSKALLEAINMLIPRNEYERAKESIKAGK